MGFLENILGKVDKFLTEINPGSESTTNTDSGQGSSSAFRERDAGQNGIRKYERPYWERNWRRNGEDFVGHYVTPYGSWEGYIRREHEGQYEFLIINPPSILRKSAHWRCFMHQGGGIYEIHLDRNPKDITHGIISIETFITEAFRKYGG